MKGDPQKTQVVVAVIGGVFAIIAAVVGTFAASWGQPQSKAAEPAPVNREVSSEPPSKEPSAQPQTPEEPAKPDWAGNVFRDGDPYAVVLGEVKLGMKFSAVQTLNPGAYEVGEDILTKKLENGPFSTISIHFDDDRGDPKVKRISLDGFTDRDAVVQDAIRKLGTDYKLSGLGNNLYTWHLKDDVRLEIKDNEVLITKR